MDGGARASGGATPSRGPAAPPIRGRRTRGCAFPDRDGGLQYSSGAVSSRKKAVNGAAAGFVHHYGAALGFGAYFARKIPRPGNSQGNKKAVCGY